MSDIRKELKQIMDGGLLSPDYAEFNEFSKFEHKEGKEFIALDISPLELVELDGLPQQEPEITLEKSLEGLNIFSDNLNWFTANRN